MGFFEIIFSLSGRINRAKYWLGSIFTALIFVGIAAAIIFARGVPSDPEELNTMQYLLPIAILELVFLYPWTALMVKRLHDRNRPTWFAAFMLVPMLISVATNLLGLTGDPEQNNMLDYIIGAVVLGVGVWFFIELGCLRGTIGDNQYGPDPLAGKV